MAEVAPFAAIHFNPARVGRDLSALLAPPYDVLDAVDKERLLAQSPYNIVAIDLPHMPPKSAGPRAVYEEAARQLQAWLNAGVLVTDNRPALYVYHQTFQHDRQQYTRRMFIARVRLERFGEGSVLPHEQTFAGPKEDRLALTRATQCQLSPIFGLYTDPQDRVGLVLATTTLGPPDLTGVLEEVENRLWVVCDDETIAQVRATMAEKRIYIADGHHRYTTALAYRDEVGRQYEAGLPLDHPANYVMFALCSMDDPGRLILPYHRVLAGIDREAVLSAWSAGVAVSSDQQADLRLYDGRTDRDTPLRFTNRDALEALEPGQCAAWRQLDYAYLHRYLIDELLIGQHRGQGPTIHYVKSATEAKRTARDESGVALLMNATPMARLREVAEAGGLMPQKSTYFYPKLATGLTLHAVG